MDEDRYDTSDQLFMRLSLKQHNNKLTHVKKTVPKPVPKFTNVIIERKYMYNGSNEWWLFVDKDDGKGLVRGPGRYHTVIVTQQVSRNTYDVFNLWYGHIRRAEFQNPTVILQPCQFALLNRDEVIVSLLVGNNHEIESATDMWMADAIKAATGAGSRIGGLKMELFSWCTSPMQGIINNKANKQLLNISSNSVSNKPFKTQLKRAQIGMQLILCELKRNYLAHISGLFVKSSFLSEITTQCLFVALWADHMDSVHSTEGQLKRLPFELISHIFSFISAPLDSISYTNSYEYHEYNMSQFMSLLFQNNNDTNNITNSQQTALHHSVFNLTNVGSMKNRPHLISYCNKYINQFTHKYNDNECPICFENLNEVSVTLLKCKHSVCSACWKKVVKRSSASHHEAKCPLCRAF